jgi:hypothetical protein
MILNNAPQDQAVLSNVGQIGEFRIRNSAKAFSILSSGLYANKVRAIVRELSCNAIDSHTAAGKSDVPFEVHLPNALEPFFSIRDFGTGLSHDQVTQIYTTYFESTKTDSNAFIGALGLGSKSPFSYTDNFTVTALQGGRKGIYTAFINAEGVPSIALMMEEECAQDDTGIEVKFSVNERYDFAKFIEEARNVYTFFKLRPVVKGASGFTFNDVEYDTKDIIPGVHSLKNGSGYSKALMGNIAYPIDVPKADTSLGSLRELLGCQLVIEFDIGELDFQASREGLSYIPSTIEAIRKKLELLNSQLYLHIKEEAEKFTNLWERSEYLFSKKDSKLWLNAVVKYVNDTDFKQLTVPTGTSNISHYNVRRKSIDLSVSDIASKYNIAIRAFSKGRGGSSCSTIKSSSKFNPGVLGNQYVQTWDFDVEISNKFVVNDTKIGVFERAKFHWRENNLPEKGRYKDSVYVLDRADRAKEMDTVAFFNELDNPPVSIIHKASTLKIKERVTEDRSKNVSILRLEKKHIHDDAMVWRDGGKVDSFDPKQTYYYLPLSGFVVISTSKNLCYTGGKDLHFDMKSSGMFKDIVVYGVRKTDIDVIKAKSNWINLETHLQQQLTNIPKKTIYGMARQALDSEVGLRYNKLLAGMLNQDSPFLAFNRKFEGVEKIRYMESAVTRLCNAYGGKADVGEVLEELKNEQAKVKARYPLLDHLDNRVISEKTVAEYINLIDEKKGI